MKRRMKKGIGGILIALIMITSVAAVIPMAAGSELTRLDIAGYKHDGNDDGLAWWTIVATEYWTGNEYTATTNDTGYWEILELLPGNYTVTEKPQGGWTQTEPEGGSYTVYVPDEDGLNVVDPHNLIFKNEREYTNPGTGTPGYWKNHPWPAEEITIGGVTYSKAEAIAIMNMPDGDKTYTMFRALVAAKLNVIIGNDASCISETIDDADDWMATYGSLVTGEKVKAGGKKSPWRTGEPLYEMLDAYNNGELCAPPRD